MSSTTHRMLHIDTPLIHSPILSSKSGHDIYLKFDNMQPCGSFKLRGVGTQAVAEFEKKGKGTELVCSSGGNAGLACSYAGGMLGLKCTVVVPLTTSATVIARLKNLGAVVIRHGAAWDEADQLARELVASNPKAAYIHPFEGDELVKGHATMIAEIKGQLEQAGVTEQPDAVVCSVGGGGLLGGILQGLTASEWSTVPVIFCETTGASCLYQSLSSSYAATPPTPTQCTLASIDSIATTLGAKTPSLATVQACFSHPGGVVSVLVSDKKAVEAVVEFAADHQVLVEPACGVCFVPFYDPATITPTLSREGDAGKRKTIVIIVCGGSGVDIETVNGWTAKFEGQDGGETKVTDFRI